MPSARVLVDPLTSLAELRALVDWAETLDLAYAWAASARGSAEHWKALPLGRVRRAVIGIHFAQTEPYVLGELHALGVLRVIADTAGVFHPKLMLGTRGQEARALVGSSNLTSGGFAGNTEVNILLTGQIDDPELRRLACFVVEQWQHPRAFVPDSAWFDEYARMHANRPAPPTPDGGKRRRAPRIVERGEDLNLDWMEFVDLIGRQERRATSTMSEIHVFDHPDGSYLQEIERCQAAFSAHSSYSSMSEEDRKLIAGWGGGTSGYYGRMTGAGYFKNLTRERPGEIAKHLDKIELVGNVTIDQVRGYLTGIMALTGVALGAATRLLCVKRPDCFLPANSASLVNIHRVFGASPNTVEKYLALLERVWQFAWVSEPMPSASAEARIWRARVALLDAIFYEPPEYLR